MSSQETPDDSGDTVPWDDLDANQRREFTHMLQEAGLDVSVDEAERYYGARHKAEADIRRQQTLPDTGTHDDHYGLVRGGIETARPRIELYGVGEFHPDVAGAGTPVFEARVQETDSYLTFCLPPDSVADEGFRIFHANSYEEGEFSLLMDRVIRHFQGRDNYQPVEVVFTNVVTEYLAGGDLLEKVRGFDRRTVEVPETGEELIELVGTWDPRPGRTPSGDDEEAEGE
jgi:hypothetical protein